MVKESHLWIGIRLNQDEQKEKELQVDGKNAHESVKNEFCAASHGKFQWHKTTDGKFEWYKIQ